MANKKKMNKPQSKQDQRVRVKQIISEVSEEFPDESLEYCLSIAQDKAQIEGLTVSVYDAL